MDTVLTATTENAAVMKKLQDVPSKAKANLKNIRKKIAFNFLAFKATIRQLLCKQFDLHEYWYDSSTTKIVIPQFRNEVIITLIEGLIN